MNSLLKAARIQNEEVQKEAIQSLIDTVEIGYDSADAYLESIGKLTVSLLDTVGSENFDSTTANFALEYWT